MEAYIIDVLGHGHGAEVMLTADFGAKLAIALAVYVVIIFGGGYLIRWLTHSLLAGSSQPEGESQEQLRNAGMYIGWLERFLILTALLLHSPATAGLVLTAKAIARYPQFKHARFAEYFLIGTLLSLSVAMIGGLILLRLLYGTVAIGD